MRHPSTPRLWNVLNPGVDPHNHPWLMLYGRRLRLEKYAAVLQRWMGPTELHLLCEPGPGHCWTLPRGLLMHFRSLNVLCKSLPDQQCLGRRCRLWRLRTQAPRRKRPRRRTIAGKKPTPSQVSWMVRHVLRHLRRGDVLYQCAHQEIVRLLQGRDRKLLRKLSSHAVAAGCSSTHGSAGPAGRQQFQISVHHTLRPLWVRPGLPRRTISVGSCHHMRQQPVCLQLRAIGFRLRFKSVHSLVRGCSMDRDPLHDSVLEAALLDRPGMTSDGEDSSSSSLTLITAAEARDSPAEGSGPPHGPPPPARVNLPPPGRLVRLVASASSSVGVEDEAGAGIPVVPTMPSEPHSPRWHRSMAAHIPQHLQLTGPAYVRAPSLSVVQSWRAILVSTPADMFRYHRVDPPDLNNSIFDERIGGAMRQRPGRSRRARRRWKRTMACIVRTSPAFGARPDRMVQVAPSGQAP